MDLNALMGTMLSGDSISNMSQLTGASQSGVQSVLSSVLPSLLSGAQGQAQNESTAAGFTNALQNHATSDTSNLTSFLSNVDLADGGKIVGHLLGNNQQATTQSAAAKSGLDVGQVGSILAAAAPLLMSLLGKSQSQQSAGTSAAAGISNLLGGADIGSLLGGLLGGK